MTKGWTVAAVGLALLAAAFTYEAWDAGVLRWTPKRGEHNAGATVAMAGEAARSREASMKALDTANEPPIATSPTMLEGWNRAQREAILRLVRELTARGDAGSLLDAALLLPLTCDGPEDCGPQSAERARLLGVAAALAPEHPLIAFLQAETCMYTRDCAAAYRRLALVDPENLFAYLGVMHAAAQADDRPTLDRALRAAATVTSYDAYNAELAAELERALRRLPAPSAAVRAQMAEAMDLREPLDEDGARLLQALGLSSAMGFPPLQALLQTCSMESLRQEPTRRAPCLAVMARMAGSDTTLARSVGLTRLVALTAGTPDAAQWRERLREFAWVYERYLALPHGLRVADLRLQAEQGEWATMRAVLGRHGVPLQPPAGWVPRQGPYRELLSGNG